jgi:2'-5' RNA ligase
MKLPFVFGDCSAQAESLLVDALARLCTHHPCLEIQLTDVGVFDSQGVHGYVVHACIALTPMLRALHDEVVHMLEGEGAHTAGLTADAEIALFYPHLTIAQNLSREAAGEVLASARAEPVVGTFVADRLVVAECTDARTWRLGAEVTLAARRVAL